MEKIGLRNLTVSVVGLGYVGLPLALAFGQKFKTLGFDIDSEKIIEITKGVDETSCVSRKDFADAIYFSATSDIALLQDTDVFIIAVPTPVDDDHLPDLASLTSVSELVGKVIKKGAIVVYESTVFPGATEEICVPILERVSNLVWKKDFHVAYSPERINPGDKEHTLENVVKVVAGDNERTTEMVASLYESVVKAGVYSCSSIQVAEAAKVIENTQRDLNIALVNEFAKIFKKMNLDTMEVLKAAETKWNFLPFKPGLVGGHCIGVDPYYLAYKSNMLGYHADLILAGRVVNDSMASFVAEEICKSFSSSRNGELPKVVTILGLAFKENCTDLRNSKVLDLVNSFRKIGCDIYLHDPLAKNAEVKRMFDACNYVWEDLPKSDVVVLTVPHKFYLNIGHTAIAEKVSFRGMFADVKSVFNPNFFEQEDVEIWRL